MAGRIFHFFVNDASGGTARNAMRLQLVELINRHTTGAIVKRFQGGVEDIERDLNGAVSAGHIPVIVGGDGSLSRAVTSLMEQDKNKTVQLGYIPMGTGNDAGRSLGLDDNVEKIFERLLSDESGTPIDCVRVTNEDRVLAYSMTLAGFGLPADVIRSTPTFKFAGALKYSLATIATIFGFKPQQGTMVVEQSGEQQTLDLGQHWLTGLGCAPYTGGGMKMVPNAQMNDGQAELVALKLTSPLRLISLLLKVFSGNHVTDPNVLIHPQRTVSVNLPGPTAMVVDGERLDVNGQVNLEVVPKAVRIFGARL